MKKTKLFSIVLALVMVVSAVFVLVACNNGPAIDDTALKEIVAEGQKMTFDQLKEKAKQETGSFVAYGNTSRITTAMDNFIKAYGEELGISKNEASKLDDSNIYTKLTNEEKAADKSKNASVVLIQDSASLMNYRSTTSMLTNYVPMGMEDKVDSDNLLPLAHQFINKLFMYNTAGETNCKFTNVWQLTEAKYNKKIFFKSPTLEQVNMNFLIMLTNDEWSGKLEAAYKTWSGGKTADDVGNGKLYKNYGYKWIAEFLNNCNFSITSDTTIAQKLSTVDNKDKMGLFVLSKLRDNSVYGDNLAVSAWDEDANKNLVKIEPFAGFMYAIYAQLATNGPRPYTAMLFVNYLMTEDGFTPWKSLGGYSANNDVPIYSGNLSAPKTTDLAQAIPEASGETVKYVYADNNGREMVLTNIDKHKINESDEKATTFKTYTYIDNNGALTADTITDKQADGSKTKVNVDGKDKDFEAKIVKGASAGSVQDKPLSFWRENLVIEDGAYVLSVKIDVEDWINRVITSGTGK